MYHSRLWVSPPPFLPPSQSIHSIHQQNEIRKHWEVRITLWLHLLIRKVIKRLRKVCQLMQQSDSNRTLQLSIVVAIYFSPSVRDTGKVVPCSLVNFSFTLFNLRLSHRQGRTSHGPRSLPSPHYRLQGFLLYFTLPSHFVWERWMF